MSARAAARSDAEWALATLDRVTGLLPQGETALFEAVCLVVGPRAHVLGALLCCAGARVEVAGDAAGREGLAPLLRELLILLRSTGRWLDPDPLLSALARGSFESGHLVVRERSGAHATAFDLVVALGTRSNELPAVGSLCATSLRLGGHALLLGVDPALADRARAALSEAGLHGARCEMSGTPAVVARGHLGLPTEFPTEVVSDQIQAHSRARYALLRSLARGKRVLDVGCGAGIGTRQLAGFAPVALVGAEGSLEALELARAAPTPADVAIAWRHVDLEQGLPGLPTSSFDLVVCLEVLEHIRAQRRLVDEMRRVLRPEGVLAISVPHGAHERGWAELGVVNPYHLHVPDLAELRAHLSAFPSVHLFVQADLATSLMRPLGGELPEPVPVHVQGPGQLLDEGTFSILALAGPADLDPRACLPSEGWTHQDHQAEVLRLSRECQRLRRELAHARRAGARSKWIALGYPSSAEEPMLQRALGHARWLGSDLSRRLRRR